MIVALTGATGFVGGHVAALLTRRGHHVRALVRQPERAVEGVEVVRGDLADRAALRVLCQGAAAVVHLVGIIAEWGRATFRGVHVQGTEGLLDAARAGGVARFVHMSAIGARPAPTATLYHRTKWAGEEVVRRSSLSTVILRPSLISGPGNVPIATLARVHRFSPVVPVFGDGHFPTQPVWVEDVALAFAIALERSDIRGTFELGGPQVLTFEEFVRAIGRAVNHPRPLIHVPLALVRLGAKLADPLGPYAPITSSQLRMLVEGTATPANAIATVFGIQPLSFEEGLRRFLR